MIKVIHFHNGTGGGVLSVIRNLLFYNQHDMIENHVIYTINKEQIPIFTKPSLEGAVTEQVFYYSSKWNFYYTCRQLSKLLPDEKAVIVAHDWLELGMVSNLGLQNPVFHVLHGNYDYYYNLALKHQDSINKFIVVANDMNAMLQKLLPDRTTDINYFRLPVPQASSIHNDENNFNVIFVGRLTAQKGFPLLFQIANELKNRNHTICLHIVGEAFDDSSREWESPSNVKFHGHLDSDSLYELFAGMNLIILPSLAEGMPLSIIEAMKSGVIPLVNNIPGGIQELVVNGITGYKIDDNNINNYVNTIEKIYLNTDLAQLLSKNAREFANKYFDPFANTGLIADHIFLNSINTHNRKSAKIYGSRLDQKWLPNLVVKTLRQLL